MTIKHLYPTQRPSLDLNFASTKRLDPRVTFTRGSTATYVNAEGVIQSAANNEARFDHDPVTGESLGLLVEESRINLLTYSEEFDNSAWQKNLTTISINTTTSPTGELTADTFTINTGSNYGRLSRQGLGLASGVYTLSYYLKNTANIGTHVVYFLDSSNTNHTVVVASFNGELTSEWTRFTATVDCSAEGLSDLNQIRIDFRTPSGTGDGTNTVDIWGAQLEEGSFPTSYIPTPATFTSRATTATYYDANGVIQTAAIDVARDDAYLPDENGNFVSAGLLLEESRTNLYPYSETSGSWNVDNNATISTDGTTIAGMSAYKLTSNIDTNSLFLQGNDATFTANNTYTSSVYHKPGNVDGFWFEARFYTGGGTPKIYFDSSTETWSANSGTFNGQPWSVKSQKVESNAWRHSITFYVDTDTAGNLRMGGLAPANTTDVSTGDYGYLAAPQIETGSFPTSYIPTAGSTVTRAADVSSSSAVTRSADLASMTGTNFSSWYNQSEGTVFADKTFNINNGHTYYFADSSLVYNRLRLQAITHSGDNSSDGSFFGIPVAGNKTALGLQTDNVLVNGGTPDTSFTMPSSLDRLFIGRHPTVSSYLNGHIKRFAYYPQRLPDATLQALTL